MKNIIRVATIVPKVSIGSPMKNAATILETVKNVDADIIVTPELSITGYTCHDMFLNSNVLDKVDEAIKFILKNYRGRGTLVVGAPYRHKNKLYNCAVVITPEDMGLTRNVKVAGLVPKTYIPNYSEFYEKRHFTSGRELEDGAKATLCCVTNIPFSTKLLFGINVRGGSVKTGIEICEDLWAPNPPSTNLALMGAEVILNLSASNEVIGKATYRRDLVRQQSARCICGYVYCSAGRTESVSDVVFGGHQMIAENGRMLKEVAPFKTGQCIADIDVDMIRHDRILNKTFADSVIGEGVQTVHLWGTNKERGDLRDIKLLPFVPSDSHKEERCNNIFDIQVAGLATRWETVKSKKLVLGISGGLDSTLALLVAVGAADLIGRPRSDVLGITMPCFGTTDRTKNNAVELMKALGCEMREINIGKSVTQHLKDIELSMDDRSVAFENAQARERTQVLMDIGNAVGGFVVGTGDLSESALGWATYNGDHMSMYNPNGSIPKTLVRSMVEVIGYKLLGTNDKIIKDILATPISPELLPADKDGNMTQLTEDSVGPYVLNDFFLYYTLRYGLSVTKIKEYCKLAVSKNKEYKYSDEEITKWLGKFYERFARAQFKRNCCPDGVKVGSVSFSPRGDWRMPTEFDVSDIMNEIYGGTV